MADYIMHRKRDTKSKNADVSDESEEEETKDGGFVLDPERIFDDLPQPYRLIDKTLHYIFDKTWEAIENLEIERSELGVSGRIPLFECAREIPDIFQPTLVCSSSDGKYTFIVASTGTIHVVDAKTSSVIATNEELQGSNVLSLSTNCLDGNIHFVCTLQENGSAAIFALSNHFLHLLRVFNEESSVKNSVTTCIQISFDGNYIGVGWNIPLQSSWLEIYKIPKEFWINEIEIADNKVKEQIKQEVPINDHETGQSLINTLGKDSSDSENESVNSRTASPTQDGTHVGFVGETSFSKPTLVLKVRSPTAVVPNHAGNASSAFKAVEADNNVIGTGTNHILLQQYFDHSNTMFHHFHQQYLQYLPENADDNPTRIPTIHFLTPGRFISAGSENTPDQVNSVVVHWSGNCHAFMYSLVKGSKAADVERKPDLVLATSSKISVSDVSVCRTMISFGLESNNIVTWDMLRGLPLNVINFPTSSTIISLHFLPAIKTKATTNQNSHCQWKNTPPPAKLLACSENGGLHIVEYNQEGQGTVSNLYPSSFKTKDPVVQITYLPNLPKLVVIQRRSGSILVMDVCTNTPKCQIGLIKPLTMLQGFCYARDSSVLFMKGGLKDEYEEEIVPESVSVFTMNIKAFPAFKCYYEEIADVHTGVCRASLERCIEQMETARIETREKRERHRSARWRQFEAELRHMKKNETLRGSIWFSGVVQT